MKESNIAEHNSDSPMEKGEYCGRIGRILDKRWMCFSPCFERRTAAGKTETDKKYSIISILLMHEVVVFLYDMIDAVTLIEMASKHIQTNT